MAQRRRQDAPGVIHHVYTRGLCRRTAFESDQDIRVFVYLLVLEVRRGTLDILAFCFLTTHVHLVVRSRTGELGKALRRVINGYVRWFNRTRRRDGSLFRGRFGSRPIKDPTDLLNVIAYVDDNAVGARLAATPGSYAHGSAACWLRGKAPPWLETETLSTLLGVEGPGAAGANEAYDGIITQRRSARNRELVEAQFARRDADPEPLDDLIAAAPERVLAWMLRKAALADQTRPGMPVATARSVDGAWVAGSTLLAGSAPHRRGPGRPKAKIARVALLRDLAGLAYAAVAERTKMPLSSVHRAYRQHTLLLRTDASYRAAFAEIGSAALRGGRTAAGASSR